MAKTVIVALLGLACTPVVFALVKSHTESPAGAAVFSGVWLVYMARHALLRVNLEKVKRGEVSAAQFAGRWRRIETAFALSLGVGALWAALNAIWWLAVLSGLFCVLLGGALLLTDERGRAA